MEIIGNLVEYIKQASADARRITITEVMGRKLLIATLISVVWWQSVLAQTSSSTLQRKWCSRDEKIRCVSTKNLNCNNVKYRKIDGSCNNPYNPAMGMSFTAFTRLLPPDYADHIYAMPVAASGRDLPSARDLSYKVFGRTTIGDPHFTHLNQQFGQIVTHDTSLRMPDGLDGLRPLDEKTQYCCTHFGRYTWRNDTTPCSPIPVNIDDPYFTNRDCLDFDRSVTDKDQKCKRTADPVPAEQLNGVTHYLDLSLIYGNRDEEHVQYRKFQGGLMETSDPQGLWPPRTERPEYMCEAGHPGDLCYEMADPRTNQNLGLISLTIIFLREHNRLARELASLNRHWDDETIFQEARRINIAQYQYITYYEWNPNFYGFKRLLDCGLIYKTRRGEHVNDYDSCMDPRTIQSFAHGSFRYFHNQIKPHYELANEARHILQETLGVSRFRDKPGVLEEQNKFNKVVRGLCTQHAAMTDRNFDFDISENFMLGAGLRGRDLRAFDIQRARDHGIPKYNDFREFCGFKKARRWEDYNDFISAKDIELLKTIYESFADVELAIGAGLETHLPNSLVGPTFECISLIQFEGLRKGDRYFFENGNQPYPFTPAQLEQIRKASIARLLCDNSGIDKMQPNAFKGLSGKNPLVKCRDLPYVDLRYWKE